jgi:quercetin dioxygenase-like cupin family protein
MGQFYAFLIKRLAHLFKSQYVGPGDMAAELIEDPVFRYRVRFAQEGDVLRGEFWVEPGGGGKIEHHHPTVEERFQVLEGELTYRVNGRRHRAEAGELFTVAAGVRHAFENRGEGVAHLVVEMEPALNMQDLFEDAAALGRAGKWRALGRRGIPAGPRSLLDMADFLDRYREIFVPSSPPRLLQRVGVPPLARLARRRRGAR